MDRCRSAAHNRLLCTINSTIEPGFWMNSTSYHSSLLCQDLGDDILSELKSTVSLTFDPAQQQKIPGDVLFGLTTALSSSYTQNVQNRYTRLVAYAAEASIPAAQGISGRLLLANGVTNFEDSTITMNWLQNAVSSGSLLARQDLAIKYSAECQEARDQFRAAGAYNDNLQFTKRSIDSYSPSTRALDSKKFLKLCKRKTNVDASIDQEGNTFFHYAATFGKCDTKTTWPSEGAPVSMCRASR